MTTASPNPIAIEAANSASAAASAVLAHRKGEITQRLNFANFNQDFSCLSCGYSKGYRVYNCEPFGQCFSKTDGSIGIVEMLFTTSLLALVGTGEQDALSPRRLKVVNTKRHTTICELTFPDTILAVKMNRERLVVLLEATVYVYDINNMRLLHTVEIPSNPDGLIALSASSDHDYLAYPSPPRVAKVDGSGGPTASDGGRVASGSGAAGAGVGGGAGGAGQIRNGDVVVFNCKTLQPVSVIEAHKKPLAAMALSSDGTLLATASDKGTIVRVFSVEKGTKLYQFRRGTYPTRIFSLAFSIDNRFVVASSATETVHVFRLGEQEAANTLSATNRKKGIKVTVSAGSSGSGSGSGDGDAADAASSHNTSSDDEDDEEALGEDDIGPDTLAMPPDLTRKKSASSTGSSDSAGLKKEPVVDSSRRSMARILRRTSQTLGRKAAEKMGTYLPPKFSSILEPNRHFASLKVPASKDTSTIVGIGAVPQESLVPSVYDPASCGSANSSADDADLIGKKLVPVMVVTSDGFFYNFGLDPERGGDCVLLNQRSLLE